jgi:hypothetical protein
MIDLPQKHYFKEVYNTIFIREKSSQISSIIIKISSFSHWNSCRSSVNFTIYHLPCEELISRGYFCLTDPGWIREERGGTCLDS